jgi:CubicO group peptidase (beta-lactamase class C family)
MADLERDIRLTTSSVIEAGSVSKQFTAAAILLLEQQGKLSLDDDVRKYIPELPDYGTPVKLRQMLHHTSWLRDWVPLQNLPVGPVEKSFIQMMMHWKLLRVKNI